MYSRGGLSRPLAGPQEGPDDGPLPGAGRQEAVPSGGFRIPVSTAGSGPPSGPEREEALPVGGTQKPGSAADGGPPLDPSPGPSPLVSVVVVAYNHERYIREAIESVLMQETEFPFEILVSEDCSTDSTATILREYRDRYPERIRLFFSEWNLCSNEVLVRALRASRGRYVALLDGDDYWISPHKLQMQVDFLNLRPEYGLCFHDVVHVEEDGSTPPSLRFRGVDPNVTTERLLVSNPICTVSVMIRAEALSDLPEWYVQSVFGDWELFILISLRGRIGFLADALAVYRRHRGGYWIGTAVTRRIEMVLAFYDQMDLHLEGAYREALRRERRKYPVQLAVERAGIPPDARVLVASGGDYGLLYQNGRYSLHFPRGRDYLHIPLDPSEGDRAVTNLEELRGEGAEYLVVPEHTFEWLERCEMLREHLDSSYPCVRDEAARIYRIAP